MLELLQQNTNLLLRWSQAELAGLAEVARFFSFNKSSVLARREEPVDYFGLVVSGLAVAIHDDAIIADLPCLEMIGYMALLDLPGAHYHFFDVMGESDGVLLTLRLEEAKELQLKHPTAFTKLQDIAAAKCLEVVRFQYLADSLNRELKVGCNYFTDKRIAELFEFSSNALLKEFWTKLENKERTVFGRCARFFEVNPKEVLIQKQLSHSTVLFVLKGECIAIDETNELSGSRIVIPQGDVFGVVNFLEERPFDHNVYCRQKGVCMIVKYLRVDTANR